LSKKFGLEVNVENIKVMTTSSECNIFINNEKVEQVNTFKYLGALITDDAECTKDIRARLGIGLGTTKSLKKIIIDTKVRLQLPHSRSAPRAQSTD